MGTGRCSALFAVVCARLLAGAAESRLEDGTYLMRLLFVRHGFSCANVPWLACTKNGDKLTRAGMGPEIYDATLDKLDDLLKPRQPYSMVGMDKDWGIKPRGWPIPGKSKTSDGKSDDCILKVLNKSLEDDQYDEFGNMVAIRQLVRDPHLIACDQYKAKAAAKVLGSWLEKHHVELDLVASSSMRRAIETSEEVYVKSPAKNSTKRIKAVTILPYINEKNSGTPFQPENFPYSRDVQESSMREVLGFKSVVDEGLTSGNSKASYPRIDQQWDKFKVVLALDVLPGLAAARSEGKPMRPLTANAALVATLEAGRADGSPEMPVQSKWPDVRDAPLKEVTAGDLHYAWDEPTPQSAYMQHKEEGAIEFTLGIGSHGNFLGMYCLEGGEHPNNLAVLEKLMVVRVTGEGGKRSFKVSEVAGKCKVILEAPAEPKPGTLSKSDLGEACMKDAALDVSLFMDLQSEPAAGKLSPCKADAESFHLAEDAEETSIAANLQERFTDDQRFVARRMPDWYLMLLIAAVLGGAIGAALFDRVGRLCRISDGLGEPLRHDIDEPMSETALE